MGDTHLSASVKIMAKLARRPSYITSRCDLRVLYTPIMQSQNISARVMNAFIVAVNEPIHLPRMVVLFLDQDFEEITGDYDSTEMTVKWLIANLVMMVHDRKKHIPSFASRPSEPKFIIIKPTPLADWSDPHGSHKARKCIFNQSIKQVIAKYDHFFIVNVDAIKPDNPTFYERSGRALPEKGLKACWSTLDDVVDKVDHQGIKPYKWVVKCKPDKGLKRRREQRFN